MENATRVGGPSGEFEFGPAVSTARSLIRGNKRHAFLLWLAFAVVVGTFDWFFGPDPLSQAAAPLGYTLFNGLISGVQTLAIATFGLTVAAGKQVSFGALFRFMERLPYLLMVTIPLAVLFAYLEHNLSLGASLLLGLAFLPMGFMAHYVIDREMGAGEAIVHTYRLVLNNLGEYLKFVLLGIILVIPGVLTLGIAMIWIFPFLMIVPGIMFRAAEGLQQDYGA